MPGNHATPMIPSGPIARVGRSALGTVTYLGGIAILAASAGRALARSRGRGASLLPAMARQWTWLFGAGLPLVGLIHVSIGSFLAMQAYYGATFVEAAGPVVGTGLYRNFSPLLAGFILAGLLAGRITPELRRESLVGLDDDPSLVPDREVERGERPDPRTPPEPARLVAVRVAAAAVAGPILAFWGATVGLLVGLLVAQSMLGVPWPIFVGKFLEMLWVRDVVGLVVKGSAFAMISALLACFEGLRGASDPGPDAVPWAAFRAAGLSILAILLLNLTWFTLAYFAGPAFGPTVLAPPGS